jgi:hypothetical protein
MANTPIEIGTRIRIEADEAAWRYGPNCFDLRCVMASRGDTLSDTEVLEMLRCLNRRGSIFSSTICRV